MADKAIALLVSGRGSNALAILAAIEAGQIAAQVAVVISDNRDAQALKSFAARGITTCCVDRRLFHKRSDFEAALVAELERHGVELVVLAGFMRLLGSSFISRYARRIMNIHPSLLPAFPGLEAHEQAIRYGAKVSGCTVHFVDEGMDTGPVILQQAVPVYDQDTAQTLAQRILVAEHQLYPEAIRLFCQGRLAIEGRKVRIDLGEEQL